MQSKCNNIDPVRGWWLAFIWNSDLLVKYDLVNKVLPLRTSDWASYRIVIYEIGVNTAHHNIVVYFTISGLTVIKW